MDATKRKQIEKEVYDYSYQPSQSRPTFGSFFEAELTKILFNTYYSPRLKHNIHKYATNKKVLVIGASRKDIDLLIPATKKISAIDISEKMVSDIKKIYPYIDAFVADAENLDKLKAKYDVVFCKSILHHLHPFESVIEQIRSRLKPGGVMLIGSEPGLYNPFAWFGRRFTPSKEHTPGERAFNYNYYQAVIGKYFETLDVRYYFFLSLGLAVVPSKIKLLKPICQLLIKPVLTIEEFLQHLPFFRHFYWLTTGVYRVK